MVAGFRTMVGGQSIVQIDSEYSNMVEVARGVLQVGQQVNYSGGGDQSNMVFVRPSLNVPIGAFGPAPGGQTGQGVWPAGEYFLIHAPYDFSGATGNVKYAVYAHSILARSAPTSGAGLLILDPQGRPRYYSGWNYVKVVANLIAPPTSVAYEFNLPTPATGSEYYFCLNNLWLTTTKAPDSEYGYFAEFVTATRIKIYTERWASEASATLPNFTPPAWHTPSIMIAEVPL